MQKFQDYQIFIPFVSVITVLTKEIAETFENVQYNKFSEKNTFLSQNYYKPFEKYVTHLKKIKEFAMKFLHYQNLKVHASRSIKCQEINSCSSDLNLGIFIITNEADARINIC